MQLQNITGRLNELHSESRAIQERLIESWSAVGSILTPLSAHHRRKQGNLNGWGATEVRHMIEVSSAPDAALAEAERLGWSYRFNLSVAARAARRAAA